MNHSTRRIHLLANSRSGKGAGETLAAHARKIAEELKVELIVYEILQPGDLDEKANQAIQAAKGRPNDVLVAAGGDGTIRCVAEKVAPTEVMFGVIPCGTFNFFARTHQIPEDLDQALRLVMQGQPRRVRLGEINGRIFLINASLGLYAQSIAEREGMTKRFGRKRFVVIISTLKSMLKPHRLLHVTFRIGHLSKKIRTPMIFIGNNALQLRNLALPVAKCAQEDLLALIALKPVRGWEMVRVLIRGISRTLEKESRLEQFCIDGLEIETKRTLQLVALDGEKFWMQSPLMVRALPEVLNLVKPPPDSKPPL